MSWVAVAVGGASVVSGIMGANAASSAASTQAGAARYAADIEKQIYDQQRADQMPWRDAGVKYLGELDRNMGDLTRSFSMNDFQADPGYDFRMKEAMKALETSASARGKLGSGATMKALLERSQNLASEEYGSAYNRFTNDQSNRFNRLASMAGVGQSATNQMGQAGQSYAKGAGDAAMNGANAQAAGIVGQSNAVTGAVGQGMNTWMQMQMMNRMFPQAGG